MGIKRGRLNNYSVKVIEKKEGEESSAEGDFREHTWTWEDLGGRDGPWWVLTFTKFSSVLGSVLRSIHSFLMEALEGGVFSTSWWGHWDSKSQLPKIIHASRQGSWKSNHHYNSFRVICVCVFACVCLVNMPLPIEFSPPSHLKLGEVKGLVCGHGDHTRTQMTWLSIYLDKLQFKLKLSGKSFETESRL